MIDLKPAPPTLSRECQDNRQYQHDEQRPLANGFANFQPRTDKEEVDCHGNRKAHVSHLQYSYPLKLMVPKYASRSNAKWLYPISYGGGLLAGDHINLNITVGTRCCVVITTQGSTKVYKSDRLTSRQTFNAKVESEGFLAILPDPVVCFANARYQQTQVIHLSRNSNLILLDWMTAGRMANGEHWQFTGYSSQNSIYLEDSLVFRDSVTMADKSTVTIKQAMGSFCVVAMCVLLGPQLQSICEEAIARYGKRKPYGYKYDSTKVVSVSSLSYGVKGDNIKGVVIRISSQTTSEAFQEIDQLLSILYPKLGGDPFENKY
ncbi:uncharacterized protein [Ptychodera flava]|uniref:uncharacterized protein n=1 Tax=Ptychodera flava TaxID=63121 RepID=UPI00396A191C